MAIEGRKLAKWEGDFREKERECRRYEKKRKTIGAGKVKWHLGWESRGRRRYCRMRIIHAKDL